MEHKLGCIPSKPDPRDVAYRYTPKLDTYLPPMADMRKYMSPIRDQGQLGSCSCEALVALMELARPVVVKSVLFPYYNTRLMEGTVNEDSGCEPRDVFKSAVKDGVCANKYWPYYISRFAHKPTDKAYAHATYHITSYHAVVSTIDVKAALSSTTPVYIGFAVYESFESAVVSNTGIMPMPKSSEQLLGYHAVVIVGYDDTKSQFIVRNSWGKHWGAKGYFYMPYSYFVPDYITDIWVATI